MTGQGMISPSVMCADFGAMAEQLREMEGLGIEYLHVDIMDGVFVPNYTLGVDFCRYLKRAARIPLDYHLMITEPERKLDWFPVSEGDIVSVHCEAGYHIHRALQQVRKLGGRPFAAISPGTPVSALEWLLPELDGVLVMTVNPGFAGQKMVPGACEKIAAVRRFLDEHGAGNRLIEVDGNVSFENARKMRAAGADIFVAGTSSLFRRGVPLAESAALLREAIR